MNNVLNDKIRILREMKHWSQEQMAERINMSKNGYAKMERGESRLAVETLDKIAQAFDMEMIELISLGENGMVCLFSENNSEHNNGTQYGNYYQGAEVLAAENEKLQLIIKHNEELLSQKDNEIATLKILVETLKNQS